MRVLTLGLLAAFIAPSLAVGVGGPLPSTLNLSPTTPPAQLTVDVPHASPKSVASGSESESESEGSGKPMSTPPVAPPTSTTTVAPPSAAAMRVEVAIRKREHDCIAGAQAVSDWPMRVAAIKACQHASVKEAVAGGFVTVKDNKVVADMTMSGVAVRFI
jgi:hypothetical protein